MTNEEAIKLLINATYSDEWQGNEDLTTAHNMAIKALEQEAVLDKIEAEIEALPNANPSYWHCGDMVDRERVLDIIDECMGKHTSGGDTE